MNGPHGVTVVQALVLGIIQGLSEFLPISSSAHLTLARARDRRRGVDLRSLCGGPVAASWPVREICLVQSHLSSKGANYEVVENVSLGDARTIG